MIRNYIKTAWRSLIKNKVFSFINVFGLAVGLACCMFIAAYLYSELTYDTYSVNSKQLYRVGINTLGNGGTSDFPMPDVAVGPGMKAAFPQILAVTRLMNNKPVFIGYDNRKFKEQKVVVVDSNFLQLFSIPFIEGNSKTALTEPNSIVLTSALAEKYFGNASPVGKTIEFDHTSMKVTGVIDKIPDNSHFHYDAFVSMATMGALQQTWSNVGFYTYVLLDKNADPKKLEAQFPQLIAKYVVPETQHDMGVSLAEAQKAVNTFKFYLKPITDIHLHTSTKYDMEPNGDISYVYIFGALAVFILLLAAFMIKLRVKEIGIRKVLGASSGTITGMLSMEFLKLVLIAVIISFLVIWFVMYKWL